MSPLNRPAVLIPSAQRYAGMGVAEIRRLEQLVADLTLDKAMLQDVLRQKWRRPPAGETS